MTDITKRTPSEVAEQIVGQYSKEEAIKIVLAIDGMFSTYDFTFPLVASLLHDVKEEGDYTSNKAIQEQIKDAQIIKKYD